MPDPSQYKRGAGRGAGKAPANKIRPSTDTRFSGRPATPPTQDIIMREAMDAEEISAGFWPGDKRYPEAAFWAYAYPKPDGLEKQTIAPAASYWNAEMGLFMLRYEDVRTSKSPHDTIREFLTSTYDVCAAYCKWDAI